MSSVTLDVINYNDIVRLTLILFLNKFRHKKCA